MATPPLPTTVQQARYQGEFMAARERDEAFTREGGTFFYAVDLNIVYFFADPAKKALPDKDDRALGYAGIFDDDPADQAAILAVALAEFIAQHLSPNSPMLLIPPVDLRVLYRLDRLKGSVGRDHSSMQNSVVQKADAEKLLKQINDKISLSEDQQISITTALLTILYLESGESSELARLNDLLASQRLVSTTRPSLHENDPKSPFFTMFSPNFENHAQDYLAYFPDWVERIDRSAIRAEMSARVMARLQTYNERLEQREKLIKTGKASRLLLITGDRGLLEAGRKVRCSDGETFTDRYLRHPRSYLSDLPLLQEEQLPGSEAVEAPGNSGLTEFGSSSASSEPRRHWLQLWPRHDAADSDSDDAHYIAEELKSRWRSFLAPAVARYRASETSRRRSTDWRTSLANTVEDWQATIDNALKKSTAQAWENCFFVATRAHLFLGQNPDDTDSVRDAPPIYLDAWPETSNLLTSLLSWRSRREFEFETYKKGLEAIKIEVAEDNYLYAYYLAHSALFAGRGEWSIAASVAEYACQHLHLGAPAFAEKANGREALYFEAVCRRHAARSVGDLKELERFLDKAQKIAWDEVKNARAYGKPKPDCVVERFKGERYALRYSRLLFMRFLPSEGLDPGGCVANGDDFRTLRGDLEKFWGRLLGRIAKARITAATEDQTSDESRRLAALSRVKQRTAVNILSLIALDEQCREFSSTAQKEAYGYIKSLQNGGDTSMRTTSLSRFGVMVADCATARFDESVHQRKLARDSLALCDPKKVSVFPYDLARSQEMLRIALR